MRCKSSAAAENLKSIGGDCHQLFFFFSFALSSQSWKPSSGSLTADSDTVGGWLAVTNTPGGLTINQGREAPPTDSCLMADDTKYAVIWPQTEARARQRALLNDTGGFHFLMR